MRFPTNNNKLLLLEISIMMLYFVATTNSNEELTMMIRQLEREWKSLTTRDEVVLLSVGLSC
jgi:hypothetical protein